MMRFLLAFFITTTVYAQNITNFVVGTVVPTGTNVSNVVSGGGGGCTPSYANTGGTGDRHAIISIFQGVSLFAGPGGVGSIVTNTANLTSISFFNTFTLDGVNTYIGFDFGSAVLITEDQWLQENSTGQGTWKWQGTTSTNGWVPGVNDGIIWTDIGTTFSLATSATTTHTAMSANTTQYRFYRELGMSGSTSGSPWTFQVKFKICGLP